MFDLFIRGVIFGIGMMFGALVLDIWREIKKARLSELPK
jgi:hypothetical protein